MPRHLPLLLAAPLLLTGAALPRTGPVPEEKPAVAEKATPNGEAQEKPGTAAEPEATIEADSAVEPTPAEVPTPEPKPPVEAEEQPSSPSASDPTSDEDASAGKQEPDASSPAEEPQDKTDKDAPAATGDEDEDQQPEQAEAPPPIATEDPEALKACLADLVALGTKFETAARIDDGEGCGIDHPLEVAEVLPGIDTGSAQMRCETARALGNWLKDTVNPALKIAMPDRKITGLITGSTYACRLRNSAAEGEISEHARGNAIDIAAFRLDDGSEVPMKPRAEDGTVEGAFQRTASAGACLHFTTVLSPGSDATHQDHLHLDVLERESGYRYCR
ncbi:extensin-like domain-containing protein [Pseudorhizobium tarimense]|uniref:extensin-like domain-containing protein n=1 Tax=Pseudorhizobium tarimense TaxID=1079109 RepID=UPI001FF60B8A|nr:extensin family protein [Pseudorhizobium tarimense]MCJ8519403.1 extensin family protein [Pseudorhizobium tarimense]